MKEPTFNSRGDHKFKLFDKTRDSIQNDYYKIKLTAYLSVEKHSHSMLYPSTNLYS